MLSRNGTRTNQEPVRSILGEIIDYLYGRATAVVREYAKHAIALVAIVVAAGLG